MGQLLKTKNTYVLFTTKVYNLKFDTKNSQNILLLTSNDRR